MGRFTTCMRLLTVPNRRAVVGLLLVVDAVATYTPDDAGVVDWLLGAGSGLVDSIDAYSRRISAMPVPVNASAVRTLTSGPLRVTLLRRTRRLTRFVGFNGVLPLHSRSSPKAGKRCSYERRLLEYLLLLLLPWPCLGAGLTYAAPSGHVYHRASSKLQSGVRRSRLGKTSEVTGTRHTCHKSSRKHQPL